MIVIEEYQFNHKTNMTSPWRNIKKKNRALHMVLQEKIKERKGTVKNWCKNDFEIGCSVGKGKFGNVYMAREKETKVIVALKEINVREIEKEDLLIQAEREIDIQSQLKHPNILTLYTYFLTMDKIVLVLEFAGQGELYRLMKKQPECRFREGVAARFVYQVADALNYCHSKWVIHRDIKPENILLDINGNIKLSDFGWSIRSLKKRKTLCGTLDYIAPEIVEDIPYTSKVDNWGLGILCFELLAGYPPFQSETEEETLRKIVDVEIEFPTVIPPPVRDLIMRLLKYNPNQRLSLNEVMSHNWITKYKLQSK